MGQRYNHIVDRETVEWGSYGKELNEPLKKILIKDLSNDHLDNIIPFIMRNKSYGYYILQFMLEEQQYRIDNNIFVPTYKTVKPKTNFIRKKGKK